MIEITKEEANIVRRELGDTVSIAITCKQKKGNRKRRYMEENKTAMRLIKQIRRGDFEGRC